jgi:hypothetical protein
MFWLHLASTNAMFCIMELKLSVQYFHHNKFQNKNKGRKPFPFWKLETRRGKLEIEQILSEQKTLQYD